MDKCAHCGAGIGIGEFIEWFNYKKLHKDCYDRWYSKDKCKVNNNSKHNFIPLKIWTRIPGGVDMIDSYCACGARHGAEIYDYKSREEREEKKQQS